MIVLGIESSCDETGVGIVDLHDDGTMALYAHLQRGGVIVAAGERVRRGQIIAFSGNTGASGAAR